MALPLERVAGRLSHPVTPARKKTTNTPQNHEKPALLEPAFSYAYQPISPRSLAASFSAAFSWVTAVGCQSAT